MADYLAPATIGGVGYLAPLAVPAYSGSTASTVTVVTVTPSPVSIPGGSTFDFNWQVLGTNSPSQAVTLATSLGSIDSTGLLTAPAATSADQPGTVTVTSTQDTTKKGYAYFTVLAAGSVIPPSAAPVIALYAPMLVPKNVATPSTPFWPLKKSEVALPPGVANVGEYGFALSAGVGYNLSANTSLAIKLTRPDGTFVMRLTPLVTVGAAALATDFGTFAANEYAVYLVQDGDFTIPGVYVARIIYTDASKRLVSEPAGFVVNA